MVYPALLPLMRTPRLPVVNWHPRRFKWTRPFRRKTKSGFCTCAPSHFKRILPVMMAIIFLCFNIMLIYVKGCRFSSYDCFIGWTVILGVDWHHFSTGMHLPKVFNIWSNCVASGKCSMHTPYEMQTRQGMLLLAVLQTTDLHLSCHMFWIKTNHTVCIRNLDTVKREIESNWTFLKGKCVEEF